MCQEVKGRSHIRLQGNACYSCHGNKGDNGEGDSEEP